MNGVFSYIRVILPSQPIIQHNRNSSKINSSTNYENSHKLASQDVKCIGLSVYNICYISLKVNTQSNNILHKFMRVNMYTQDIRRIPCAMNYFMLSS